MIKKTLHIVSEREKEGARERERLIVWPLNATIVNSGSVEGVKGLKKCKAWQERIRE